MCRVIITHGVIRYSKCSLKIAKGKENLRTFLGIPNCMIKGLVINYGEGGYKMGEPRVRNFLHPPPPSRQDKTVCAPPPPSFDEWKLFVHPPPIWLKLQATV